MKKNQKSTSNFLFLFSISFIVILLSSCGAAYYGPARLGSDIAYQPKPMLADSIKSNTYLNATYTLGSGTNLEDENSYLEFNLSRAHALKNVNLSYGCYGYLGNYANGTLDPQNNHYFVSKSYGGYGFRFSANYVMASGRTEFRFPGIELGYSKELGQYADFRRDVLNQADFFVNPNTQLFTLGGSAEVIWHQRKYKYNRFSFRLFIGKTPHNNYYIYNSETLYDNLLDNVISWSFLYQHKRVSFLYESAGGLKLGMIYNLK